MERHTPTVAELVRRAVEACDPEDNEQNLGHFEEQLEDDDEPVTAVENLEERLALAAEGADYEIEDPAVSVATAVVLYLAAKRSRGDGSRDPQELMRLAVRAQWHRDPPEAVVEWLADRSVRL
jgi:CheY-like chemotaxis protein